MRSVAVSLVLVLVLVLVLASCGDGDAHDAQDAPSPPVPTIEDRPLPAERIPDPWGECPPHRWVPVFPDGAPEAWPSYAWNDQELNVMPDGRVLVGSVRGILDPKTGSFRVLRAGSRKGATTTLLADGRTALIAGGDAIDGTWGSSDAFLVDVVEDKAWRVTSMKAVRQSADALLLPNGKVMVYGGTDGGARSSTPSIEVFDPATLTWSAVDFADPIAFKREGNEFVVVAIDDKSVFVASNGVGIYDLATGTLRELKQRYHYFSRHWAVRLLDGRILSAGENPTQSWAGRWISNEYHVVDVFDPKTESSVELGIVHSVPVRTNHNAKVHALRCGVVSLFGGTRGFVFDHALRPHALGQAPALPPSGRSVMLPDGRVLFSNVALWPYPNCCEGRRPMYFAPVTK